MSSLRSCLEFNGTPCVSRTRSDQLGIDNSSVSIVQSKSEIMSWQVIEIHNLAVRCFSKENEQKLSESMAPGVVAIALSTKEKCRVDPWPVQVEVQQTLRKNLAFKPISLFHASCSQIQRTQVSET
jgi:hypothetical protein